MGEDPIRVLQVLGSSTGGVARHVAQISAALAAPRPAGGAMIVQVAGPADLAEQVAPAAGKARFHPVPITDRPGPHDARTLRRLHSLARGAQVVHAHGLRAGALAVIAVRSMPSERRPRVVVTLHNLPVGGRGVRSIAAALERLVARGADVVLGVSRDLVERAEELGAKETARALVPAPPRPTSGRPASETRRELGVADTDALLVTIGRLAPQKGLDLLCGTAAVLRDRLDAGDFPGITRLVWVVAGGGPLEGYLSARIVEDDLPVVVLGHRDDVPDLIVAADLVVSTSVWEGQPIWLQEAMQLGAAVVATDVGGTSEVTADGAALVTAADAVHMTARIAHLLTDVPRRRALGEVALERAAELPTIVDVVAQLTRVYAGPTVAPPS